MRRVIVLGALFLVACDPGATPTVSASDTPGDTSEAMPTGVMPSDDPAPESVAAVETEAPPSEPDASSMCWADYCPCDTSDPDYGYADISICRDLRMGVPVSDAMMSIGAKGRDARKALREWKEDNPGSDF